MRVREIAGSDSGSDGDRTGTAKKIYYVTGSDDTDAMRAAVLAVAPTDIGYKQLDTVEYDFDDDGGGWIFTVNYTYKQPESSLRWSFDGTGGTIRVSHSQSTTKYPSVSPNFNHAIGVGGGQVEGTDIVIPALKITGRYRWPAGAFALSDAATLADMAGTMNSDLFGPFAAGSALFLGATGEIVEGIPTDVDYHFAISKNASGLSIGSISGIAKKGHDFLWILWEEDVNENKLVKKPLAVYVERVYTETAFSSFGIM